MLATTTTGSRRSSGVASGDDAHAFAAEDITKFIRNVSSRPVKHGGPSDIYFGTCTVVGGKIKVALKVHRIIEPASEKIIRRLRHEIKLWKSVNHPCTQPMLGLYLGLSPLPAMVSPWCNNGDINAFLRSKAGELQSDEMETLKLRLISHVFRGLRYLHRSNIVHADIKGPNVLISDDSIARLSDFGFSAVLAEHAVSLHSTSMKGTYRWMAPELLAEDGAKHTMKTDIWAAGCLVLEVFSGRAPYYTKQSDQAVILALSRNELPQRPPSFPDPIWRFVLLCCSIEPEERPPAEYAYERIEHMRRPPAQLDITQSLTIAHSSQLYDDINLLRSALPFRVRTNGLLDSIETQAMVTISEASSDEVVSLFQKPPRPREPMDRGEPLAEPDEHLELIFRSCVAMARNSNRDFDERSFVETIRALIVILKHFSTRERYFVSEIQPMHDVVARYDHRLARELMESFIVLPSDAGPRRPTIQPVTAIIFASERRVVIGHSTGDIFAWDISSRSTAFVAVHTGNACQLRLAARVSLDRTQLVSASTDASCEVNVRTWDSTTGRLVTEGALVVAGPTPYKDARVLALSHDGTFILSGTPNGAKLRMRDADGHVLYSFAWESSSAKITSVEFSPNGSIVVAGTSQGDVRMWDSCNGQRHGDLTPLRHNDHVTAVAISTANEWQASGSRDGSLLVAPLPQSGYTSHDARFLAEMSISAGGSETVAALAFSIGRIRGAQLLAVATNWRSPADSWTATHAGLLAIWDVEKEICVAGPFPGHRGTISRLVFSPDDRWLISGADNGETMLWDVDAGWACSPVNL